MTRRQLRARLRARLRAHKASVRDRVTALRQRRRALVAQRRGNGARAGRRVLLLLAALVLLWLLLRTCENEAEAPVTAPRAAEPAPAPFEAQPGVPTPIRRSRSALKGKLARSSREDLAAAGPGRHRWLHAFQLQVTSRSPRLAECFRGAPRPGALRWTAAVDPSSGAVSEHVLEPLGATTALSRAQRTCLLGVLTSPAYSLQDSDAERDPQSTPVRATLVVEF